MDLCIHGREDSFICTFHIENWNSCNRRKSHHFPPLDQGILSLWGRMLKGAFVNCRERGNRACPLLQIWLSYHPSKDVRIVTRTEIKLKRKNSPSIWLLYQTRRARPCCPPFSIETGAAQRPPKVELFCSFRRTVGYRWAEFGWDHKYLFKGLRV